MNAARVLEVYNRLLDCYGEPGWWPARSTYEVMVGAVLTQNCAWSNVVKAIDNIGGRLSPGFILDADSAELIAMIRPAGFFNQKAGYLKAVTRWYQRYGFDAEAVRREPLSKLRGELLGAKGVGRETADAILLYAFGLPSFVVDAYTVRLLERLNMDAGKGYEEIKRSFELNLALTDHNNVGVYNRYHALIVVHGKERCHKKPACAGCPIADMCGYKADENIGA
ncbi:MAG: endonuclease [Oscillospiraceae bacterium]|jgi:endonuclease-3 related protein|nr:endonuclease [Oscillospiraceae bacterium]